MFTHGKIKQALESTAQKVGEIVIEEARMDYIRQRKSTDPTSMVIDSMTYDIQSSGELSVMLTVFCDGAVAPHAKYVEFARQSFPGYYFMRTGGQAGARVAGAIAHGELLFVLGK